MEISKETLLMLLGAHKNDPSPSSIEGRKTIAILQRGWVIVGRIYRENDYFRMENSSVIRSWGTTKGLGEIALNGPTDNTKLDSCGTVRFAKGVEVGLMDCNQDKWNA